MLAAYGDQGLRLIEVDKADMGDLGDIVDRVGGRPERFIIFCDDLSFEEGEPGYKALKSLLDGSVSAYGEKLPIHASQNRRHSMPENLRENLNPNQPAAGELHTGTP